MIELIHPAVKFLFAFICPLLVVGAVLLWLMPSDHKKTNRFLSIMLLFCVLDGAYYIFYFSDSATALDYPELYGLQSLALYLIIPGFYLFVRKVLNTAQGESIAIWPHFILFAVITLGLLPLLLAPAESKHQLLLAVFQGNPVTFAELHLPIYTQVFVAVSQLAYIVLVGIYLFKIYGAFCKHKSLIAKVSSDIDSVKTRWVTSIMIFLLAYTILMVSSVILVMTFGHDYNRLSLNLFVASNALLYGFVALQAVLHPYLYTRELEANILQLMRETNKEKYQDSHLSDAEVSNIEQALLNHLHNNKPYLQESLTLRELSTQLGIDRMQTLSEVINRKMGQNFYQLINQYRIQEATALLSDSEKTSSITQLAFSVGYNSISTFNRQFKQVTGMSPKQYLNQNSDS